MQYLYKIEEVFWLVIADVIYLVWRDWESVVTVLAFWGFLHDAHNALHDVIDIGEVAFTVAVVEYLDGLALDEFVGKAEICHVGTTSRTIDGEEAQTCGWDIIELGIGMCHQFVALLCRCIERDGVIHFVIGRIWHFLVAAIY